MKVILLLFACGMAVATASSPECRSEVAQFKKCIPEYSQLKKAMTESKTAPEFRMNECKLLKCSLPCMKKWFETSKFPSCKSTAKRLIKFAEGQKCEIDCGHSQ